MTGHERWCVQQFYQRLWHQRDMDALGELLCEDFHFRGSLGTQCQGHAAFARYLEAVHTALADYRCRIEESGPVHTHDEAALLPQKEPGKARGEKFGEPK